MKFDVDELARATALSVDTIRYYQSMGLLHAPSRAGRRAFYDRSHVERLEQIRALAGRGFSLKAVQAVLEDADVEASDRLLLGAVEAQAEDLRLTAGDLAERAGVPPEIVAAIERAGLADAEVEGEGRARYSAADLRAARAAVKLLRHGFPLNRLLRLAIKHDRSTKKTVDAAIDLFDAHVRRSAGGNDADPEAVARAFRELLPAVTALVAHHFQRTLVSRALGRLRRSGERRTYRMALEAAGRAGRKRAT